MCRSCHGWGIRFASGRNFWKASKESDCDADRWNSRGAIWFSQAGTDQYSSFNTNGEMTQAYSYSNYYAGGFTVDDTTFTRNALGQITLRSTPAEGQRWNYQYDSRGQASKAYKTFISSPQQVAAGTQAQYTYDQIGNRLQWMEGGTSTLDSGLRVRIPQPTPPLLLRTAP